MELKIYPIRLTEIWYPDENNNINIFTDENLALDYYQINEIGGMIWKLCDGLHSNLDIAFDIYNKSDISSLSFEGVKKDVNNFLMSLKNSKILNWNVKESTDVLLVVPPYPDLYSSKAIITPEYSAPPLGLAYIGAVLESNGFNVSIYDMHIETAFVEDIIKKYRELKPKIIGISSTTPTYPNALKLAQLLKAYDSSVIIALGGAHATSLPTICAMNDVFNFVVIGEGEQIMHEIAESIINKKGDPCQINGIAFRDDQNNIKINKPASKIKNLDHLPYPARNLLKMDSYYQKGSIISSRGCPYDCIYCACPLITGREYREHSIEYVLDEIDYLQKKYNINYFDFHDDSFNLIPTRVLSFTNKIKERNMTFKWGCFCRVNNFNFEIAKAMKSSGCEVIQFGIESGNQKVLDSIKKKINLKEIEEAVLAAKKAKINQIACGFIIGHPEDTEESINETIEFGIKLTKLGATRLSISVLTPYPGTEVFSNMENNGVKLLTENWENFIFSRVIMETKHLNKNKLRELYAKGVLKFLNASNK